ncbi:hypothetical protein [Erythrobacter tepidarius]|uniref:hypothetical protein n=1 Tax=Erythrobacter tepidarius TaxID=60454 RepID=UPI000A373524|nr:hypothetical protein [Erythrobacter tepidarius]
MAEATRGALLDLDTLIERPFITIDGERVEILHPDELSVIESHRFGVWGRRIEELAQQTGEEAEKELDALVATVARKICVGASDALFARLPGTQRWAIIDLFTALRLRSTLKVAGAMEAARGELPAWIGASSSPGSSGSTADGRRTGWRRFLPGW